MRKSILYLSIFLGIIGGAIIIGIYLFQNTRNEIVIAPFKEANFDTVSSEVRIVSREEPPVIDASKNERIVVSGEAMEIRNIKNIGYPGRRGDIYIDNKKVVENFPFSCWDGCELPKYDKFKNIIFVNENGGDMCSGGSSYTEYNIATGNYTSVRRDSSICFVPVTTIVPGGNKKDYEITSHEDSNGSGLTNKYSVLSISMTGGLRRNYIYDNNKALQTKEDFLRETDIYVYTIGGKKIVLDFSRLEKSNEKMPLLWYGGENSAYFDYQIYLTRDDFNHMFVLHFDKVKEFNIGDESPKKVKNIGIVSCKGGNSVEYDKEYILKTKDEKGNYKYNISEKLNNKCDISYKINVYYFDGTIETGEYYVLFDY